VEAAREGTTLTYFEFTTLAILSLMAASALDVAILEVGLGGRLDAVNAIDTDCAILTSIDLDHMDYLGPDRESIGREKAGILRAGKPAIVSDPVPPHSVVQYAQAIGADLWLLGRISIFSGDQATVGLGRRGPPLSRAGLSRVARRQPVTQCLRRAGAPWRRCARGCR
jgi:dihydrofolate synthase/folylpolyglutamate synthase